LPSARTNSQAATLAVLDGFNIAKYFEAIVGGDVVPFRKPDPRHLLAALEQLCASPNESVMIGDNENDHAAARAAGVAVVLMRYGYLRVPRKRSRQMRGSISLPTSRQRSTESIERGSANHLAGSIEKSGIRAAANDARESLGFQHEQKRRRAEQLFTRASWIRSKQSFSPPRKVTPQKNLKSCEM
jgi:hypothetical protein